MSEYRTRNWFLTINDDAECFKNFKNIINNDLSTFKHYAFILHDKDIENDFIKEVIMPSIQRMILDDKIKKGDLNND